MSTQTIRRRLARLETRSSSTRRNNHALLEQLRTEPADLMALAGIPPDPWQRDLLGSDAARTLLLSARQTGKSTVAAALALVVALLVPRSPILILSPTDRQSGELFRKILDLYQTLGCPVPALLNSQRQLHLANGSRILSLPGSERTTRGYSAVALLLIDEASRVDDALYRAVRPMLAVSHGRLIALSTPFGTRGWFYDAWHSSEAWQRVCITAEQCPRITPAFLAEERQALGDRWYRQEYFCSFEQAVDAVFREEDIQAVLRHDVRPFFVS
jgi:hypothetical protein